MSPNQIQPRLKCLNSNSFWQRKRSWGWERDRGHPGINHLSKHPCTAAVRRESPALIVTTPYLSGGPQQWAAEDTAPPKALIYAPWIPGKAPGTLCGWPGSLSCPCLLLFSLPLQVQAPASVLQAGPRQSTLALFWAESCAVLSAWKSSSNTLPQPSDTSGLWYHLFQEAPDYQNWAGCHREMLPQHSGLFPVGYFHTASLAMARFLEGGFSSVVLCLQLAQCLECTRGSRNKWVQWMNP